jgi:hypothetical protein
MMLKRQIPEQPTREVQHYQSHGQTTYHSEHHFSLNKDDQVFEHYPTRYRLRQGAPVSVFTNATTGAAREEWSYHPDPQAIYAAQAKTWTHFSYPAFHHREDGPAIIERNRCGDLTEQWFQNGAVYQPTAHERMKWEARKHARGGPFHDETLESLAGGTPTMGADREVWMTADRLHRENAPAIIERNPQTGRVLWLQWSERGDKHRLDGPASQLFHPTTGVCIEGTYHRRGKLYRLDGPADIRRDPQGNTTCEEWWRNGATFRQNGPSLIHRDETDPQRVLTNHDRSWFLNGRRLDKPTPKALQVWEEMVAQQGGPFTESADQVPQTGPRPGGVKAAAAAAKVSAPKPKTRTGDAR